MDFITLDFETATSARNSPCELGLTFVRGGQVVETKSWLIKPIYPVFDEFNVRLHGIHEEDVVNEPEFDKIWDVISPLLNNQFVIAHNAGFDMSVLRHTLDTYSIPCPELSYTCSYVFSKRVWINLPSYSLSHLCSVNGIDLSHHRAAADSLACANLSLKAFEISGIESFDQLPQKLRTTIGKLSVGSYVPSQTKKLSGSHLISTIVGDSSKHQPDHLFYQKQIVFTGTLMSMIRSTAQQFVADIGGINSNSVSKSTDFLVVGQQDYKKVGEDGMSSKQEKALKLASFGTYVEILSENEFSKLI